MGQSVKTQIIEFNGLAGCGKTTLAKELKKELIQQGYRVVLFGEACQIFKKHPVKNIIRFFNLSLFIKYIRFFLVIGRKKENTLYIYWAAIIISTIYQWCLKIGEFDFLLCDHGLIQNIISLLGFEEFENSEKEEKCLAAILKAESKIYMVNCNVPLGLACERIRLRKKTTGRLDVIGNNHDLKKLLLITEINFFTVRNFVQSIQKEWPSTELQTDISAQINVQRILNLLQRNKYNEF